MWTSENRKRMIHIARETGQGICGKEYPGTQDREQFDISKITCKKCLSLYKREQKEVLRPCDTCLDFVVSPGGCCETCYSKNAYALEESKEIIAGEKDYCKNYVKA
jgi:hypothetical protein